MTIPKAQTITYRTPTQEEQDELNKAYYDLAAFGQSVVIVTKESADHALSVKHIPLKDIPADFTQETTTTAQLKVRESLVHMSNVHRYCGPEFDI